MRARSTNIDRRTRKDEYKVCDNLEKSSSRFDVKRVGREAAMIRSNIGTLLFHERVISADRLAGILTQRLRGGWGLGVGTNPYPLTPIPRFLRQRLPAANGSGLPVGFVAHDSCGTVADLHRTSPRERSILAKSFTQNVTPGSRAGRSR